MEVNPDAIKANWEGINKYTSNKPHRQTPSKLQKMIDILKSNGMFISVNKT